MSEVYRLKQKKKERRGSVGIIIERARSDTHLEIAHTCNYSTIYRQRYISIIHFTSRILFSSERIFSNCARELLPRFSWRSCLFSRRRRKKNTLIRLFSGTSNGAQGVERDQTRKIAGLRGKVRGTHHLRVRLRAF